MKLLWILLAAGSAIACAVLGYKVAMRKPGQHATLGGAQRPRAEDPIAELEKVDPRLIIGAEEGRLKTGLKELRGIAVGPQDRIYAVGDKSLVVLNADGSEVRRVDVAAAAASVTVDVDGTAYLGMRDHVEVYGPDGARKSAWASLGPDAWITSVAVGVDGVVVGDFGNRAVLRFDKAGKRTGAIVPTGADVVRDKFVIPSPFMDVTLDSAGGTWITHTGRRTIERYAADGTLGTSWGKSANTIEGFSGCCNPTHIALRKDGSFVTSEKGLVRIKIHAPDGKLVGVVAPGKAFPQGITGLDLAVDSKDRILVADPGSSSIRVYIVKT